MRTSIWLLLTVIITAGSPTAQDQPDVETVRFTWRKLPVTAIPSGKKAQEMRNAQIDAQILQERQSEHPDYSAIAQLEAQKRNQITPLDAPKASDKSYEYKVRFKNTGSKTVTRLAWLYEFKDPITQEILARNSFESNAKIGPGKEKQLTVYSDSSPPLLVNAKAVENEHKPWIESVVLQRIEYLGGSKWERK